MTEQTDMTSNIESAIHIHLTCFFPDILVRLQELVVFQSCMLTDLHAYRLACLQSCMLTVFFYSLACLRSCMLTVLQSFTFTDLHAYGLTCLRTCSLAGSCSFIEMTSFCKYASP